jgi:5-methylcytosine-specific restriction enzyme A
MEEKGTRMANAQPTRTFLLTWNPENYDWGDDQDQAIEAVYATGKRDDRWSCGVRTDLPRGSRFFLMKVGKRGRGLIGSGWVLSTPYRDWHWVQERERRGETALYVDIQFDALEKEPIIYYEKLVTPPFAGFVWTPQASGVEIPPAIAAALEARWPQQPTVVSLPEEVDPTRTYPEGAVRRVLVNAYERNPRARAACIAYYGACCSVCTRDLAEVYGEVARDCIQVHHLVPLSTIRATYRVNPIEDLRPVCPNCHVVIHSRGPRKPPFTLEEVKSFLGRGAK